MRSLERLEQQKRLKQQKRNAPPPDEELEEELERPRFVPLNRAKTIFGDSAERTFGGINSVPSVFDRQAIFFDEQSHK